MQWGGVLNKNFWGEFGQKYFFKIALVVACAYGIESTINNKFKNDCIKACLIDENGPNYKYTPIDILPVPSGRSSVSHNSRSKSECSCFNQSELDKKAKKQSEVDQWYKDNL